MDETEIKGKLRSWIINRSKNQIEASELTDDTPVIEQGYRMHIRGAGQMPRIGSDLVDTLGVSYVDNWINSLSACP